MFHSPAFQSFVEKVLIHYKLADEAGLVRIREEAAQSGQDILDYLVLKGTLTETQGRAIREKYPARAEKAAGPASQSSPPQTSVQSPNETMISMIQSALDAKASDLHFQIGQPPFIRRCGRLQPLDYPVLEKEAAESLFLELLDAEQKQKLKASQSLDFCMEAGKTRCRCSIVEQDKGLECIMRLVPDTIPDFMDLGLPPEFLQLMEYKEGLVLITGPSGSGKSTTLAAVVDLINQSRNEHIITLEEPIEYTFKQDKAHISQREVGLHTRSYSAALRAALREDPDIIVVGELRDMETTSLAVTAAETGHLVFATLHTTSAAQTIYRLLDFFPPNQRNQIRAMVSESLHGILCQQLIRKKDGTGMALATELLFMVTSIANLVREDKLFQIPNMIQIGSKFGMHAMDDSLRKLVEADVIAEEEAWFAANKKDLFKNPCVVPKDAAETEVSHAGH